MLRATQGLLAALAAVTFFGLLIFAPRISILGAAAFGALFLALLLFTRLRRPAQRALHALERRNTAPAMLEFEDYDSDWGVRFTLRPRNAPTWRVRMSHSDDKINALVRAREHAVTAWLAPETGAPVAVALGQMLLWRFEAERT